MHVRRWGIYETLHANTTLLLNSGSDGRYMSTRFSYGIAVATYYGTEVCAGRELVSQLRFAVRFTAKPASTDSRVECQEEVVIPLFFYGVYFDFRNSTTDSL